MERIPYTEARQWFWIRTAIWAVVALVVTVIVSFFYVREYIATLSTQIHITLAAAVLATLFGLIAAIISIQFPWMRLGRWRLWWVTAIICAVIAALCAVGTSAIVFTLLRSDPLEAPTEAVLAAAGAILGYGIAVSAAWGAIFGTWFSLRLDKYFVESI